MKSKLFIFENLKKGTSLEFCLMVFSSIIIPLSIFILTLVSLNSWQPAYTDKKSETLYFKVFEGSHQTYSPDQAVNLLKNKTPVSLFSTHLSTHPFWFSFEPKNESSLKNSSIELPSRHATQIQCWSFNGNNYIELGKADRNSQQGILEAIKAGFSIKFTENTNHQNILCNASFRGPARIEINQWNTQDLISSAIQTYHSAGLLEGSLLILSLFVFIAAFTNKEWMYITFSAWLIANWRIAALSAGWDFTWLGHTIPTDWLLHIRKISFAVYYLLTVTLFSQLFSKELKNIKNEKVLTAIYWSSVALIAAAVATPYETFLPIMWSLTAISINGLLYLLVMIIIKQKSKVAIWYSASITFTLLGSFLEVIAAAFGLRSLLSAGNSVSAALTSSLLAALAIAEQMRQERLQRIAAQAQAVSALAKVKANFEASPIGLFSMKENGEFLQYNPAMANMLDLKSDSTLSWQEVFAKTELEKMVAALKESPHYEVKFNNRITTQALTQKIIADISQEAVQEERWYFLQASLAEGIIEASLQDITEQKVAFDRLDFLAYHDSLTLALNQRGIAPILEKALAEATAGRSTALAYIDLDRFKLVNDLYGHLAGDEVLKIVAKRIQTMLSESHQLARIGGDEFIVVFRETSINSAQAFCEAFLHLIESRNYIVEEKAFRVKASIGLVEVAENLSARDVIAAADRACYQAKKGNHNNLVIYTKGSTAVRERLEEIQLVEALSSDAALEGLFLEMQPIMSTQTPYQTLDFEALVRMRNPEGKVIPAGRLITAAEANGRIAIIDRWVLRTMLAWMYENHHLLNRTRFACVNISGGSLNDERFVQDIRAMLLDYRQVTGQLCLEITEAVALQDLNNTRRFVDELQALGAKVALDDFGAGYTSFAYLKNLTADAVKIDGTFIRDLNRHPANYGIAKGIVELAHNLGMRSVAEWVEDRATLETLLEIGVDYVQGYAIARPMAPAAILASRSAADFIQDAVIANFVRSHVGAEGQPELWDALPPENVVHFRKS